MVKRSHGILEKDRRDTAAEDVDFSSFLIKTCLLYYIAPLPRPHLIWG
jgi:hypothetical protein